MECNDLRFGYLEGVATDRAPTVIGNDADLLAYLKEGDGADNDEFIKHYGIVHQENLCAKALCFRYRHKGG